jgi:hypothetical protein
LFLCDWGLNSFAKQALYRLSHSSTITILLWLFADEVSRTICSRWPLTSIFLISASQSSWDYRCWSHQRLAIILVLRQDLTTFTWT